MKARLCFILMLLIVVLSPHLSASAQSGGNFAITQSVTANGGGTSGSGAFKVAGTSGQPAAGTSMAGAPYNLKGGFWNALLAPTAANVAISGRVVNESGMGIRNVRVTISGGTLTAPRIALTSSFGYFTFDAIEAGQTYIVSVSSKRYGFGQPSQAISVVDNVTDLIFTAAWQN